LVLGDSVMAWNAPRGAAVADALSAQLNVPIARRAVPGAGVFEEGSVFFAGRIEDQLPEGRWDWVVLNGGANDLNTLCGCDECNDVLDTLLTDDVSEGAWIGLLNRVRATATGGVVIVGYYGASKAGPGSFARCADELLVLDTRLARLADRADAVTFASVREEFTGRPENYARDRTHPSPRGSLLIATIVAKAIRGG
jgi:lysophospholipase L1-like esterase